MLLVVEAKFKSGKSGTDENDQLVRYFEAINNDIENFTESSVSSFKGSAGKIVYSSDIDKRDYWDLWNIWFYWSNASEDDKYELDGKVNNFRSEECKYIDKAHVFSLPLISIKDDDILIEKIVKPLKEL